MFCFRPFLLITIFWREPDLFTVSLPHATKSHCVNWSAFRTNIQAKAPRQQTCLFHFSTAEKMVTQPTPRLRHNGSRFLKLNVSKGVLIAGHCVKGTWKVSTVAAHVLKNKRGNVESAAFLFCNGSCNERLYHRLMDMIWKWCFFWQKPIGDVWKQSRQSLQMTESISIKRSYVSRCASTGDLTSTELLLRYLYSSKLYYDEIWVVAWPAWRL